MSGQNQLNEDQVEAIQFSPQERTTECTVEQIVDGAVPQLDEGLVEAIGAVRILQKKKRCELEGSVVERTERERQSNLGKLWDELAARSSSRRRTQETWNGTALKLHRCATMPAPSIMWSVRWVRPQTSEGDGRCSGAKGRTWACSHNDQQVTAFLEIGTL